MNDRHFDKIFWFAVGVVMFTAALSVYVIIIDRSHIAMILTFWLSTGAAGAIGYLIGASVKGKNSDTQPPLTGQLSGELKVEPSPPEPIN